MEAEQRSTLNVCLRIKPQINPAEQNIYTVTDQQALRVKSWKGEEIYKFSHIFNVESSQEDVFDVTAKPAIKSFLQGTDCLLFAYGTTNAGKTFSVQGNLSNPGIVPRAISSIFASIKDQVDVAPHIAPGNYATAQLRGLKEKLRVEKIRSQILTTTSHQNLSVLGHLPLANCSLSFSSALSSTVSYDHDAGVGVAEATAAAQHTGLAELGWSKSSRCSLWISMVEVYNENVLDLLSGSKIVTKVAIVTDSDGRFYPQGQTEINVSTLEEAKTVIQFGNKQRKHSATLLNIVSSRSHCILRLRLLRADRLVGNPLQVGPHSPAAFDVDDFHVSTFMFCDLAGAERVNKAGNKGDRARETANINSSLVVLGRCLEALRLKGGAPCARNAVVPYRDSRLTMILQPLLQEQGPKSLLVNISTCPGLFDETLNVLRFSAIARKVVVKEHVRPVPHYQLPTHTRQLMELHTVRELEDSQLRISNDSEELSGTNNVAEVATQTEEQVQLVEESLDLTVKETTKFQQLIYETVSQDKFTAVVEEAVAQAQVKHAEEIASLNNKILQQQQMALKMEYEFREKESKIRNDLFASFETLEKQMEMNHNEQLQNTETQLYNLMNDRLNIQENYYKDLLGKKEADNQCLQDQLRVIEEGMIECEQLAKNDSNVTESEMLALKSRLIQLEKDLEARSMEISDLTQENTGLLLAYKLKDDALDKLTDDLEILKKDLTQRERELKKENDVLTADIKKKDGEISNMKLEVVVREEMLAVTSNSLKELRQQYEKVLITNTTLSNKSNEQCHEITSLKEAYSKKESIVTALLRDNANLKEEHFKTVQDVDKENKSLQQEVKKLLGLNVQKQQLETEFQNREKEQAKKFSREKNDLKEQLEKVEADAMRYKQLLEYLMEQYRPDARRSIAGCANEEAAWAIIEKEIEALPSRYAELETENKDLKFQLETKEQDLMKFHERRDLMIKSMERELQQRLNELETARREAQTLNKQMLGMTPRKQDDTPRKGTGANSSLNASEFKTPLQASVKRHLPLSSSSNYSASNSASKLSVDEDESFDACMRKIDFQAPRTSTRKNTRRHGTDSLLAEEETEKKTSIRGKSGRAKDTPTATTTKNSLQSPVAVTPQPLPKQKKKTPMARSQRKLCNPELSSDETDVMTNEGADEGGAYKKSSCRRKNVKAKATPAKENMEPPGLPLVKDNMEPPAAVALQLVPKPKARSRRKLCNTSLHPALEPDEPPVDVEMPAVNQLQETKRRLRSTYKY